jgi:2-polyprenyl-6-hydroxyphenyl methylase/3-demethylubiquinone-9 3-methyltransferase
LQNYYDNKYHDDWQKEALLEDYSLSARLDFFQKECIRDGAKVLDYGCGTGAILTGLKNIDRDGSVGIDCSSAAIEFAKSRFKEHHWQAVPMDIDLPFPDGAFDVVLSSEVIEHVFDVDDYLAKLRRVLKPNGVLGLSCPYHGFVKDMAILLSGRFESHFHNPYEPHIRFYSLKAIRRVLDKNGFDLVKKRPICPYWGIPALARMMAFKARKK